MEKDDYVGMSEVLRDTWTAWDPWMREAKTDLQFLLGDQWSAADKAYLDTQGRPHLVINDMRRFMNLLTGYQRQNRLGLNFKPWEGSDALTAEQFTELGIFAMEKCGGYHQTSRAFSAGVKTGLDWINIYMDYDEDWESGDVKFKRTPWTKMLPDPLLQEMDLSDCGHLFRLEPLTEGQAKLILPEVDLSDKMPSEGPVEYKLILDPAEEMRIGVTRWILTEFWQREAKMKNFILDTTTGKSREFNVKSGSQEDDRLRHLLQQFKQLRVIKKRKKVVTLELYLGSEQLYKGEDPNGCGDYPYVPMWCYWEPEYDQLKWKLQGILRSIRDPQDEKNKRRSQLLQIINTIATSGWLWEEGALADEDQMATASGAGVQIRTKKNMLEKVKQLQPPKIPPAIFQMEAMFANDPQNISGINAELMASIQKDTPGISIQLRQRQGLVMIQEIFDNLRLMKKMLGDRFAKCVQSNYTPQKIKRILNQEPAPQFYMRDFQKYDCVVDDAVNSPTQREYNFQKLMWFHQNVSPVHPMIMLELADIPERFRESQGQFMMQQLQAGGLPPGVKPGGGTQIPGGGGKGSGAGGGKQISGPL